MNSATGASRRPSGQNRSRTCRGLSPYERSGSAWGWAVEGVLLRLEEVHLARRGLAHHGRRVVEIVQHVEQLAQAPTRRDPEQRPRRRVAQVVVAVRDAGGHTHEVADARFMAPAVEVKDEPILDDEDEFILRRVHVRRHVGARRVVGLEGEGVRALGLQVVRVAHDVPHHLGHAGAGGGDPGVKPHLDPVGECLLHGAVPLAAGA